MLPTREQAQLDLHNYEKANLATIEEQESFDASMFVVLQAYAGGRLVDGEAFDFEEASIEVGIAMSKAIDVFTSTALADFCEEDWAAMMRAYGRSAVLAAVGEETP